MTIKHKIGLPTTAGILRYVQKLNGLSTTADILPMRQDLFGILILNNLNLQFVTIVPDLHVKY